MVLAHRGERDVAHDNHLLVARLMELLTQVGSRVLLHTSKNLLAGARHAVRRALEALPIWILADGKKELANRRFDAGFVETPVLCLRVVVHRYPTIL